jgi:putative phosphoesterase
MTLTRVAALYDIHANFSALEAVLAEVELAGVDVIVFGGDVAWGPFPKKTVERLQQFENRALFVRGNADRETGGRLGTEAGLDPEVAEVNQWCADQLTSEQHSWLLALPETTTVDVEGLGSCLFCHGSPRSDEEVLTSQTSERRMHAALQGVVQDVVVCGHTHMQFDRRTQRARVVNAGSVGLPYEGAPGAYWALLDDSIHLRRTDYDLDEAVTDMRVSGCPHVEEMFVSTLMNPPAPTEVARHFEASRSPRTNER